MSCAMFLRFLA